MWGKLGGWFKGPGPESTARGPAAATKVTAEAKAAGISAEARQARLRALCRDQLVVSAGHLHLINLSAVRRRFGDNWEPMAEHVGMAITKMLKKNLGPTDYFCDLGDNFYAVVFPGLPVEEGAVKCSGIAREIVVKLFGEDGLSLLDSVEIAAIQSGGKVALNTSDPLSGVIHLLETLPKGIIKRQTPPASAMPAIAGGLPGTPLEPSAWQGGGGKTVSAVRRRMTPALADSADTPDPKLAWVPIVHIPSAPHPTNLDKLGASQREELMGLIRRLGRDIQDWQQFNEEIQARKAEAEGAAKSEQPKASAVRRMSVASEDGLLDEINAFVGQMANIPEPTPESVPDWTPPPVPTFENATFFYRPVWYAANRAITSHACDLRFCGPLGEARIDEILGGIEGSRLEPIADLLTLRKCASDLARLLSQGGKSVITMPVHYSTLADPADRRRFIAAVNALPRELRRLLAFELSNLYMADWRQLPKLVAQISPLVRAILLRVSLDQPISASLASVGAHAVGGSLRDQNWTEERSIEAFHNFVEQAHGVGLRTYIGGLEKTTMTVAALYAGFDYLSGEAVMPSNVLPSSVRAFEPLDLYLRR